VGPRAGSRVTENGLRERGDHDHSTTPRSSRSEGPPEATWASGDLAHIATLIFPVAEYLTDAADLRAGCTVIDVACGRGNAALAAAANARELLMLQEVTFAVIEPPSLG
jgi:hypothetical protein